MPFPADEPLPTIVVYEKRPRWEPELQRQFLGQPVKVRACRAVNDILPLAQDAPQALVLLDLAAGAAGCLQFLGKLTGRPGPPAIVVQSRQTAHLEWPVRELGAVEFASEFIPGDDLARLCRRQFLTGATP